MCYVIAQTVHYAPIALTKSCKKPRNRGRAFDKYLSQVSYRQKIKLSVFRMTKKIMAFISLKDVVKFLFCKRNVNVKAFAGQL